MSDKTIMLDEMNIFMRVPENVKKLKIIATIDVDGKDIKVKKKLNKDEIDALRKDFLFYVDGGDDYDAKYVLTDAGREYIEKLMGDQRNLTDEELEIYNSWIDSESEDTGEKL